MTTVTDAQQTWRQNNLGKSCLQLKGKKTTINKALQRWNPSHGYNLLYRWKPINFTIAEMESDQMLPYRYGNPTTVTITEMDTL